MLESVANPRKRIRVHLDVGVDEHKDISARLSCAKIPGSPRAEICRTLDQDDFLRRIHRAVHGGEGAIEGHRPVGGRDNDRQRRHLPSLGRRPSANRRKFRACSAVLRRLFRRDAGGDPAVRHVGLPFPSPSDETSRRVERNSGVLQFFRRWGHVQDEGAKAERHVAG